MTDATIVGTKYVSKTTLVDKMMEIEFSSTGTYTLPKDAVVLGFIPGKLGGTAVVATERVTTPGSEAGAVLTLTVGKASATNSVFVLLG